MTAAGRANARRTAGAIAAGIVLGAAILAPVAAVGGLVWCLGETPDIVVGLASR